MLQTIPVGTTTILDIVPSTGGKLTVLADKGGLKYTIKPSLTTYGGSLTQTGALTPGTATPADADVADVAIQVVAGTPAIRYPARRRNDVSRTPRWSLVVGLT